MHAAGAALGCGVLAVLPGGGCGLAETARITGFLAARAPVSAGPAAMACPALADALHRIAFGQPGQEVIGWAQQLTGLVTGRGACHLPDGAAGLVTSALTVFAPTCARTRSHGPCPGAARPRRCCRCRPGAGMSPASGNSRRHSPELRVNPIACEAHGLCIELLPELISADPWGYPVIAARPGARHAAAAGPPGRHRLPDARAVADAAARDGDRRLPNRLAGGSYRRITISWIPAAAGGYCCRGGPRSDAEAADGSTETACASSRSPAWRQPRSAA